MGKNQRHVVPDSQGGWNVVKPEGKRPSSHHNTQAQAEDRAKKIVSNLGGGEVFIHDQKGRIRDADTVAPGNDPCPPKDTKH